MLIRTIERDEFNELIPHNPTLEDLMGKQMEWFSNNSRNLLGSVAEGKRKADWNYVILKRDQEGGFHVHKVMNNFFSSQPAKEDLLISMAELATEGPGLAIPLGPD